MKQIFVIGILIIIISFTTNSQNVLSKQNLEQASQEDLSRYLKQAKNQKTVGTILVTGGLVSILSSFAIARNDLDTGATILGIGMGATIIGIPLWIVGSSRVKKVNNALSGKVSLEIAPYNFQNFSAQNKDYGITFRIKF